MKYSVFQQIEYVESKPIRRTFWIYFIGFVWTTEFIFAFEEFSISATVAFWYFASSIRSPARHALAVLLKYHLGTIAKGSAVIFVLKIPRLIITFICKRLKKKANQLWLQRLNFLEECVGIFNHNAYAPAAFETTDFHPAASVAWKIFTKNASQVETINNVFDLTLFLSKFFVASVTCLVGITLMKGKKYIQFYMAPVLVSTLCAFYIAHIIFSIFEMTIDTLLLCVCEDQLMYGELRRLPKKSNLSKLFEKNGETHVHVIKIKAIHRQPFRSKN